MPGRHSIWRKDNEWIDSHVVDGRRRRRTDDGGSAAAITSAPTQNSLNHTVESPKLHHLYLLGNLPTDNSDGWVASLAMNQTATTNNDLTAE